MIIKYKVLEKENKNILKNVLKHKLLLSTRLINKLKIDNKILVNGESVFVNTLVKTDDNIQVDLEIYEETENIEAEDKMINVLFEDDAIFVIDKEPGIVVHPTSIHKNNTLANRVKFYYKQNGINAKIRPVTRLDRDTSGAIIFAKNQYIQHCLIKQMEQKTFKKEYVGVTNGMISKEQGTIDIPIKRCEDSIIKRETSEFGTKAVTHFKLIKQLKCASLVNFIIETGRTHQIRVHTLAIGNHIIGDSLYGKEQLELINRQALHSHKLKFIHPIQNKEIEIISPISKDIQDLVEKLKI